MFATMRSPLNSYSQVRTGKRRDSKKILKKFSEQSYQISLSTQDRLSNDSLVTGFFTIAGLIFLKMSATIVRSSKTTK